MLILHTKHAFSFKCHFVKSFYIYLFVIVFLIVHVFDIVLNTMNIFDLFLSLLIVTIIIFYNYCISFYLRCVLQTPCSVVTSPNGKWARCSPWWLPGCEGSRTKTTPSLLRFLLFLSTDHGRVRTGNRPEPSRNRSHRTFTFLRFLGDWTAPARASGAPLPACLLLVFTEMLSQSPVFLLLARCLVARALRCAVQLCSVLFGSAWTCHGATVATAAVFYYLKSRDMCVFTQRASLSVYKQRGITFIFC